MCDAFTLSHLGFNTQPPEGGCLVNTYSKKAKGSFNTQPPEGGCLGIVDPPPDRCFNTQPPEGGC